MEGAGCAALEGALLDVAADVCAAFAGRLDEGLAFFVEELRGGGEEACQGGLPGIVFGLSNSQSSVKLRYPGLEISSHLHLRP